MAGKKVGTAKVGPLGAAQIDRNSERGQFVPAVSAGSGVRVRTAAGVLIAKSSF